ncbi:hypothetical protein [Rasiella sp. SM2506]|uniref:hypothetical protein n=1 Tax=Rasiella sp. SM2506 TaxID=3423914 RepID=UPI003D7BF420
MENNKYTTGFKIPEGYFEEFDARMLDKLKEEQLPKNTGFTVPEGYFDTVEEKIVQTETTSNWKVLRNEQPIRTTQKRKIVLYAIAGVAAVVTLILTVYPFGTHNSFSFDDINATAVSAYIQDGELDLSADDLSIYLQDEDFETLMGSSEEISVENLSDYLFNNLDDTSLLLE